MIELSPATAVIVYLGITLFLIFGAWMLHHLKQRTRRVIPPRENILQCEYCHTVYLGHISSAVTKCPKCNTFNKGNQITS